MSKTTFKAFEIQERVHSPNAVIGITEDGRSMFITAPASALGKQLGDQLAKQIMSALNRDKLKSYIKEHLQAKIEGSECHTLQDHIYPMTGKLYCNGCGRLLDSIV